MLEPGLEQILSDDDLVGCNQNTQADVSQPGSQCPIIHSPLPCALHHVYPIYLHCMSDDRTKNLHFKFIKYF